MILRYAKAHTYVISPSRKNPSDAGIDVFFCPDVEPNKMDPKKNMLSGSIVVHPGKNSKLRTGLKFEIPHGYMLEVKNRSSMSSKKDLIVGGGVLDAGYAGEVSVILHNVSNSPQLIEPGDKIAQLVLIPVVHFDAAICDEGELYNREITISNRGTDGFGSSGSNYKGGKGNG